ncbi:1,5-anhydro-D-fructose reductase [Aquimixticola soesokkakensis]|uniref:1,5-anhydro-D-fructose reductase n=1 Tax=Aquimixticola soesokkakensis TaxID=1519096 RepID=A0A1Y5RWS0_9RHOB|nr:Gfo/Idh/MocA family oxidoreductase [Aquimixticola soesokkakensis]SLN26259.1 1,5-anhydro-D-fructose reductase [Aquimixticola soesokkakensis]
MKTVGIGLIGCGNISDTYLKGIAEFDILDLRGIGDLNADLAVAKAQDCGVRARSLEDIYADPDIEIIVNLTIPKAHAAVATQSLMAGKHAYSEKPLAVSFAQGKALVETAAQRGLRIGAAPDTFFGGAHQAARAIVDAGTLGPLVGGTAFFMCPGHERWHPNPDFYYQKGGGPLLDMAPYYITDLVNLCGPVARVTGVATLPRTERLITSAPRKGERIAVEVATHISALLEFANGAVITLTTSFDVAGHKHSPLEVYGTEATLLVPDPNGFGGAVQLIEKGGEFRDVAIDLPYSDGNYRAIGVADMAYAIRNDRPHRASGDLALHVLEVMEAIMESSERGAAVTLTTTTARPEALAGDLVNMKLAK